MEMASGFVSAVREMNRHVNSARPGAPVVPHVERPQRAYSIRKALANGLNRAAQAIAPSERSPAC